MKPEVDQDFTVDAPDEENLGDFVDRRCCKLEDSARGRKIYYFVEELFIKSCFTNPLASCLCENLGKGLVHRKHRVLTSIIYTLMLNSFKSI